MIVAIHQPNYLPWIGFFNKILKSDLYVVFDDVQFPRGKDFAYRNKIKTNSGAIWLSVPIKNKSQLITWNEVLIDNTSNWRHKHLRSIELSYKNSKYFKNYFDSINKIISDSYEKIMMLNIELIKYFLDALEWRGKIIYSSELDVQKSGSEKILGILQKLNATEYISGEGAGSTRYISEAEFAKKGIKLVWQNFNHPIYSQLHGEFIPEMSIIDLLFNCGPGISRELTLNV